MVIKKLYKAKGDSNCWLKEKKYCPFKEKARGKRTITQVTDIIIGNLH